MILYRTPGRSFTRPPRTRTIECSWRLWPTPGMYAVTSIPLVRRTRATLRRAEFGFFGVVVYTRVQTPRRWGAPRRAGVLVLDSLACRPLRTSWAMVGTRYLKSGNFWVGKTAGSGRENRPTGALSGPWGQVYRPPPGGQTATGSRTPRAGRSPSTGPTGGSQGPTGVWRREGASPAPAGPSWHLVP